jgi:hypothetical protein
MVTVSVDVVCEQPTGGAAAVALSVETVCVIVVEVVALHPAASVTTTV